VLSVLSSLLLLLLVAPSTLRMILLHFDVAILDALFACLPFVCLPSSISHYSGIPEGQARTVQV
jgi:hypothetical protein